MRAAASACPPALQGYEDAFRLRMVPSDLVTYQRRFQACVDNSLDCSDQLMIMRTLGQVRAPCVMRARTCARAPFATSVRA